MFSRFMGLSTDRSKKKNGHIEENEGQEEEGAS